MDMKLIAGLGYLVVLSFVIERALAVIFDSNLLRHTKASQWDFKPWVTIGISIAVCAGLDFDIIRIMRDTADPVLALKPVNGFLGIALTGLTVAGGSAGAVKLFQDVLGFRRTTREEQRKVSAEEQAAALEEAKARKAVAEATKQVAVLQIASPGAGLAASDANRERDFANRYFEIASGKNV